MKKNKKGFTLVELVIVVAVMAVLVAVAIPTVKSVVGSAKMATYNTNCRTIESVIKLAEAEDANNQAAGAAAAAGTLDEGKIEDAVNAAALGITAGNFYYSETGAVDNVGEVDDYKIAFTNGTATVTVLAAPETYTIS